MSVALTTPQVIARSKTVTRRDGWLFLKPGDRLTLCPKVMGFRRGEHPERIVDVEVLSVRRERLDAITADDVAAEGLEMTPAEFVSFFCRTHKGCRPDSEVTRIKWRYVDSPVTQGAPPAHAGRPGMGTSVHPAAEGIERIRVRPAPPAGRDRGHPRCLRRGPGTRGRLGRPHGGRLPLRARMAG
jgi:hypothetical protein